jgi:Glutamate-cysteine ligase family 2(GCS2)
VRGGDDVLAVGCSVPFSRWASGAVKLGNRPPTAADLETHLNTLFPPVRLRGYLEVRYLDMSAPRWWPAIAAVTATLMDDPVAADLATEAAEPAAQLWTEAARDGLANAAWPRPCAAVWRSPPAVFRPCSSRPRLTSLILLSRVAVPATCWPSARAGQPSTPPGPSGRPASGFPSPSPWAVPGPLSITRSSNRGTPPWRSSCGRCSTSPPGRRPGPRSRSGSRTTTPAGGTRPARNSRRGLRAAARRTREGGGLTTTSLLLRRPASAGACRGQGRTSCFAAGVST